MPEVPMPPMPPYTDLTEWSAAQAKDCIAVVTTDAKLEAQIRKAFRNEPYALIVVPDFTARQNDLVQTTLGIIDGRKDGGQAALRTVRLLRFWDAYPFIGIFSKDYPPWGYCLPFDMYLDEHFISIEIVKFANRIISSVRSRWSAANAEDRIAIITTDTELDARIRAAFRDEAYELVTVDDFESNQDRLIDTIASIFDARNDSVYKSIKFLRMSTYWGGYPIIGIFTEEGLAEREKSGAKWVYETSLDAEAVEDFTDENLLLLVKHRIAICRKFR